MARFAKPLGRDDGFVVEQVRLDAGYVVLSLDDGMAFVQRVEPVEDDARPYGATLGRDKDPLDELHWIDERRPTHH